MDRLAPIEVGRERVVEALRRRFGIDARSLAAFRVALGLLLIADLLLRSRDLRAHYTDFGVLPRAALITEFADPGHVSIHLLSGEAWAQAALFVVAGGFAAALAVGYRTRAATVASWLLLNSLHLRNPVVLNGGDIVLRMLLFWSMFLPLGVCWSVDARRAGERRGRVVGVATAALLIQVVLVYLVNAAMKLEGDRWLDGEAIYYVFSLDQFTVFLGDVIARYPAVLAVMDRVWLALVVASPLLILLVGRPRAALAAAFAGMHLGMLLTMRLGLFPLISVAALVPFLPPAVWDALLPHLSVRLRSGSVRALAALDDTLPEIRGRGLPPAARQWGRRAGTAVAGAFLVLVVVVNAAALGYGSVPDAATPAVRTTNVDQHWNMFAPEPLEVDGWYVVPAQLTNGSRVDALHGGPVEWDRPADIADTYPNARWRKYLVNLWRSGYADHRKHLAGYLCRRWDARHDVAMVNLTLYYMEQPTRPDYRPEPIRRVQLLRYECIGGVSGSDGSESLGWAGDAVRPRS